MKQVSEREQQLPPAMIARIIQLGVEDKTVVSLGHGEPDFSLPRPLVQYIRKIADKVNHYSPPGGRQELKEAIVRKVRKENKIKATTDNVVVTTGSTEGLSLAMACTMDVTEEIILPDPTFLAYKPAAELFSAVPVSVPIYEENKFEINPELVKKAITPKTLALLINTPANPTGNVLTKKTIEELCDIAVENDIYILSDEAYEKIVYDKKHISPGSLNGMEDYVITLHSFSKSYAMCGFRIGYAIAPASVAKAMIKSQVYTTLTPPTISQMLALRALKLPQKYTQSMVHEYRRRRDYLIKRLNGMQLHTEKPDGAFYAFSNISNYSNNAQTFVMELIKKAKVVAIPGTEFGRNGEGFIRFSYGAKMPTIKKAMDRLEKYLKKR